MRKECPSSWDQGDDEGSLYSGAASREGWLEKERGGEEEKERGREEKRERGTGRRNNSISQPINNCIYYIFDLFTNNFQQWETIPLS